MKKVMLKGIITFLKLTKRTLLDLPKCILGVCAFSLKNNKTPKWAHQSLINLFCLTGGRSNQLLSMPISLIYPPYQSISPKGTLGSFSTQELKNLTRTLKQDGYYIFNNRLSTDVCDKLLHYANTNPATIRGDSILTNSQHIYDPNNPIAVRYDYDQQFLIDQNEIQHLITDESIISVAQQYLNSKPILDVIGMWWHTAYQKIPDSSSAQFFHFDMDRIRWLKFFIYLTDVNPENGPHVFVKGSQRNKGIPAQLRSHGYARLTDEQILASYSKSDIIYHIASRGTIIAEDTRGLHKGQHVERGNRLVLQLQFSNHLFGAHYEKCNFTRYTDKLQKFVQQYPRIYCNYT